MPDLSVRIHTQFRARPSRETDLRNLLLQFMKSCCQEVGCSSCELLQHQANPACFILVEEWDGEARLKLDLSTQSLEELFEQGAELIAEFPQMDWYDVTTP